MDISMMIFFLFLNKIIFCGTVIPQYKCLTEMVLMRGRNIHVPVRFLGKYEKLSLTLLHSEWPKFRDFGHSECKRVKLSPLPLLILSTGNHK